MKRIPIAQYVKRIFVGVAITGALYGQISTHADEQLFGFVRGAETLPQGHTDVYQFMTLRTGKNAGDYYGVDFDTEVEYGFTDRLQASASLVNHYFYNRGVDDLDNANNYRFGGVEGAVKYRVLSPFKDAIGMAFRVATGYLLHDEVGGLPQHEYFVAPEIDLQKNFRDDTIILDLNFGPEFAWGKLPAEQYPRELALQGAVGAAYRFAPNWFAGVEAHTRAEWPLFSFGNFEHLAVYAGPSLHYASKRWWATLTWNHQVWGSEVDQVVSGKAYAEETDELFRFKIGFNF